MKTMNNFAAQQLTKFQMNTINGGKTYHCTVSISGATAISGPVIGNSSNHAALELALVYQYMDDVTITCQ